MARHVNLTIPFYPGMPVGNVWAWDAPFQMEEIVTYGRQGARLFRMSLHNEGGTRLMMRAVVDPSAPTIDQLDLGRFLAFDAVVIDVPKEAGGEITAEDIDARVAGDPDYRDGDAVLIRTGWGDGERYRKIGDDYARLTPHFSEAGSRRCVEVLKGRGTDTILTDCAYVGNCGPRHMRPEWADLPPWQRPPFPSEHARIYLRHYTEEKMRADWGSSIPLAENLFIVAALASCGLLRRKRLKVTLLPLYVEKASGTPCTVVATEE